MLHNPHQLSVADPEPEVGEGLLILDRGDVEVGYEPKSKKGSFTGNFFKSRYSRRASPIIILNPHRKTSCVRDNEFL